MFKGGGILSFPKVFLIETEFYQEIEFIASSDVTNKIPWYAICNGLWADKGFILAQDRLSNTHNLCEAWTTHSITRHGAPKSACLPVNLEHKHKSGPESMHFSLIR
jgi:hypothetical protein